MVLVERGVKQLIEMLRRIGLSELEARCYLTLNEESSLSGYEIAKRVSVSRTNVYSALRSLTDKGVCRVIEGDPVRYDVVPIEHLIRYFRAEFEQTAEVLVKGLKAAPHSKSSFYNWQGSDSISMAMRRLVATAETTIIVDIWSEDLHWIEASLIDAQAKGITVILIVLGESQTALQNVFFHKRSDQWPSFQARKFSVLCDSRFAILGSFGGSVKPSAVETEHPAVIEVLKNAFFHDVVMQHIEADFGDQLREKYGPNYEKLIQFYVHQKGWKIP